MIIGHGFPGAPGAGGSLSHPHGGAGRGRWDWKAITVVGAVVVAMHVVGFAVLVTVVAPAHHHVGTRMFGIGLGLTAYTYGLRHAFDADHIAAIDNTTRKLREDGRRPTSVGFWFALGHSSVVAVLAALVAGGVHLAISMGSAGGSTSHLLALIGTSVSAGFLYLVASLNLAALLRIRRAWRTGRIGNHQDHALTDHQTGGPVMRALGRLAHSIRRPGQMYLVGVLFGLGFDTATEVALLVTAGSGATSGLPWYAIMVLPLLFAAGMSLFDTLDGLVMGLAYDWAFLDPMRKVYYNLVVTSLSVGVALFVGTVELVSVLHENAGWSNRVTDAISALSLGHLGYLIVAGFIVIWAIAVGYWRRSPRDAC